MARSKAKLTAPQFVRYFGPVLEALQQLGGSGRPEEVRARIVQALQLSDKDQADLMASGISRFENQVHWARFYLSKAGFIDSSRRGVWSLTDKSRGLSSLTFDGAREIFRSVASQFAKEKPAKSEGVEAGEEITTKEQAQAAGLDYAADLSAKLMALPPGGFERFCQRLLREPDFSKSPSPVGVATVALTASAFSRSTHSSASRCCFSASGTAEPSGPGIFATFVAQ